MAPGRSTLASLVETSTADDGVKVAAKGVWHNRLRQWFWGTAALGYGASLLLHLLLLTAASIVIVQGMKGDDAFSTLLLQSDGEDFDFSGPVDTTVAEEEQALVPPELQIVPTLDTTIEQIAAPSVLAAAANPPGEEPSSGSGFEFTMPENGKAVTKGSFTAWTVPADPKPGKDYLVVIQIRLPETVKRYSSRDLSGTVIGTDGYIQRIPGKAKRYLPLKDHQAQISIEVPGAERLVEDTISIRSRRLNEQQTLKIVF